jgi:hypothetical protein
MSRRQLEYHEARTTMDRRSWLRRAAGGAPILAGLLGAADLAGAAQDPKPSPADEAETELKRAEAKLRTVTNRPIRFERSESFQAIGDATTSFMRIALADCELIAADYLDHYRAKGFDVRRPRRRLTLVVFFDERPFRKFLPGAPEFVAGVYYRGDNWLVLFDYRNVPARSTAASHSNMTTLAHEGTHLLAYNTGLLNRRGDVSGAIGEGIATYGEVRKLRGRSEPGQINSGRLDDLAHLQRGQKWISLPALLTEEPAAPGKKAAQTQLAYAQSWLLVYYLMTMPARLPQFRAYLKAIYDRRDKTHRLEDAEMHFGNLDRLDQELRREAIRLQQSRT